MLKKLMLPLFVLVLTIPMVVGCGDSGTLKIGLEGPMTGDYAYEGQGFEKAVTMLVEQTN